MLETELARRMIEKLIRYTDYHVNLMNEKGIIIASTDREREGTFHEIAYDMIIKEKDIAEVLEDESFLGVKSGINMSLEFDHKRIGVVGVTGDPSQVRSVAFIIRMSVESMLEYEIAKEQAERKRSTRDKFLNGLLYEDEIDQEGIEQAAKRLGYENKRIRIPLLISFLNEVNISELLEQLKSNPRCSCQDILLSTKDDKLLLFISAPGSLEEVFCNYKYIAGEYLSYFLNGLREKKIGCNIYTGPVQSHFLNYRSSYQMCLWLERHIANSGIGVYFYDHIDEYLKSQIPVIELHKIFGTFQVNMDEGFKVSFISQIDALYQNNYNLDSSSKKLFIHKNTMSFRLDKIRNLLGVNPIQNSKDRIFVDYLNYYLKRMN